MDSYEITSDTRPAQATEVRTSTLSAADLPAWLGETFATVAAYLKEHDSSPAGPPFARYHPRDNGRFEVDAGFPVTTPIDHADRGDVRAMTLPGGPAVTTTHVGPYHAMEPGYHALVAWIDAHGGELMGDAWEIYVSDPATHPDPATWRTEIVQPYHLQQPENGS